MAETHISSLLELLREQLTNAAVYDQSVREHQRAGELINVTKTGKVISSAYEQLRNAAEYAEEHLLLQRAIRRFFNRTLFLSRPNVDEVGRELITELTQAGYIANGIVGTEVAADISRLAERYVHVYGQLRQSHISRDQAIDWVLAVLSVEVEHMFNPHAKQMALAYAAHNHFMQIFPRHMFADTPQEDEQFEITLYVAVHQSLFKSDLAIVRHALMSVYSQQMDDTHAFIEFNRRVDALYVSKLTHKLKRAIGKQGAALRVLKSLAESRDDLPELLNNREMFLDAFGHQIASEYNTVERRVNRGIGKSIIFILITKVIIGVGIEVPYDILMTGSVVVLPLIINLAVPPLYMASLRLGLHLPSTTNAQVLKQYIEQILYTDERPTLMIGNPNKTISAAAKLAYSVLFFVPFGVMIYVLQLLDFNVLQMVIFFVFLSTASFLGFRLSTMIREIELEIPRSNMMLALRDFFYLPFILFGQWLTGKYAKINVVGYFLDIAIEMPLKIVLRLVRQWVNFLNEKRDEIY